jgi:uncharacterized protein (DUF427 family)
METTTSKGKEIRIPGPDHPITNSPAEGRVRVTVAGGIVAESSQALRLEEKGYPLVYYLPRNDADMSLLVRTKHYSYCPYKGDCTYYSIPIGGSKSEYAVACESCSMSRGQGSSKRITVLRPSGREVPYTWKPLSRSIGSPRR